MIHRAGTDVVNWYLLEEGGRVTIVDAGCPAYRGQVEGALLTGDALCGWNTVTGRRGPILPPAQFSLSMAQARASLDRVERIDAQTLYYGHGDPWTGGAAAAMAQARERYGG